MKKLKLSDLTPEIMEKVSKLEAPEAVVEFFRKLDFEVSEKGAARIIEQLKKVSELTTEDLLKVSGGVGRNFYPELYTRDDYTQWS